MTFSELYFLSACAAGRPSSADMWPMSRRKDIECCSRSPIFNDCNQNLKSSKIEFQEKF